MQRTAVICQISLYAKAIKDHQQPHFLITAVAQLTVQFFPATLFVSMTRIVKKFFVLHILLVIKFAVGTSQRPSTSL